MGFVKVAEVGQVAPGGATTVTVQGQDLALFNIEGAYYCIDNFCPHSGGPLAEGWVEGEMVMCPWHAWQFNVKTGRMAYNEQVCVASYPCKIEGDSVLVEV